MLNTIYSRIQLKHKSIYLEFKNKKLNVNHSKKRGIMKILLGVIIALALLGFIAYFLNAEGITTSADVTAFKDGFQGYWDSFWSKAWELITI